uniref:C2H2-type domain-containing protein n=1 Tax=Poecilia reticulata TaxID=8081 RepID=A0A3P9NWQ3_POERE
MNFLFCVGDDKEAADEEDEEGLRLSSLDALCSSTGKKDSLSLREDVDGKGESIEIRNLLHRGINTTRKFCVLPTTNFLWLSFVCDSQFESRRGLSIHSRAHLRQLGFTVSESGGSAIELLHRVAMELKKAPISSLLPVSSPLRSQEHKVGGLKCLTSNLSAASGTTTSKPLWAPQENDDIVCQLCGAWFETRKGLSSHARAHLRHFGVEYSESKGSPIELLSQLMDTDDFKHKASVLQLDSPTETQDVSPLGVGPKLPLPLPLPQFSCLLDEPPKEIGCEYCGEYFENRKGLSSHARSHLRQMGITEWSVNGSPIDTLREIITRRGLPCALPLKPLKALKSPPPSSPGPPRSPLSPSSSPLLSRLPFAFARPSSPPQSVMSKSSSAPPMSPISLALKPKPEPVQVEVTAPGSVGRAGGFPVEPPSSNWSKSDKVYPLNLVEPTRDIRCEFCGEYFENRKGLSSHARSHLRQMGITEWSVNGSPIDTLREVMHKRRSSSSSRLDQGVKKESRQGTNSPLWENAAGARGSDGLGVSGYQSSKFRKSPLSLVQSGSRMLKQGLGPVGPSASQPAGKLFRLSPLAKRPITLILFCYSDPSCELCGFYFENRKALASHARAHLRQFGVTEWSVNGSPIETLSAWIRSRPQKVLEMHRNYMQGNRSSLKKVRTTLSLLEMHRQEIFPAGGFA